MATTAAYGVGAWGAAAWGSGEEVGGSVTRTPAAAALTVTGAAPSLLPVAVRPPAGSLALTGAAAVLVASASNVTPLVGSLLLTGGLPTVTQSAAVQPPAGALAFLGVAPMLAQSFRLQLEWDTDAALLSLLLLDWEVGPAEAIVGGVLPLEWSIDELLARLRLDWDVYQTALEAAYDEDRQRPWARVSTL